MQRGSKLVCAALPRVTLGTRRGACATSPDSDPELARRERDRCVARWRASGAGAFTAEEGSCSSRCLLAGGCRPSRRGQRCLITDLVAWVVAVHPLGTFDPSDSHPAVQMKQPRPR
jgi:hypothetical protein